MKIFHSKIIYVGYHGKEISFHSNTGLHDISLQIAFIGFTSMI